MVRLIRDRSESDRAFSGNIMVENCPDVEFPKTGRAAYYGPSQIQCFEATKAIFSFLPPFFLHLSPLLRLSL